MLASVAGFCQRGIRQDLFSNRAELSRTVTVPCQRINDFKMFVFGKVTFEVVNHFPVLHQGRSELRLALRHRSIGPRRWTPSGGTDIFRHCSNKLRYTATIALYCSRLDGRPYSLGSSTRGGTIRAATANTEQALHGALQDSPGRPWIYDSTGDGPHPISL